MSSVSRAGVEVTRIHVGAEVNVPGDVENLRSKSRFACCDCSKHSSGVGVLSGTFGFVTGSLTDLCCAASRTVIFKAAVVVILVSATAGGITGKIFIINLEQLMINILTNRRCSKQQQ